MGQGLVRLAALAAIWLAAIGSAFAQGAPAVFGEPAKVEEKGAAPKLHLPPEALERRLELAPISGDDLQGLRTENQRVQAARDSRFTPRRVAVGIERGVGDTGGIPALEWASVDGGRAARVSVTSPEALALRVAVDLIGVAAALEMVFFGSAAPERVFGPYRVADIADRSLAWWSPLTQGDTLNVEFFLPGGAPAQGASPRLGRVAHLVLDPATHAVDKRLQDIGDAGACNVDLACSPLNTGVAFRNVAQSVAQMVFSEGGFVRLCTGTLLNDADASTQTPWFFSANHCFDNDTAPYKTPTQMQAVANTLSTLWFFDANACGSSTPVASWQQVAGGATYLYSNHQSDALFLRLNNPPPPGAFYAGWDASPAPLGSPVLSVHHPEGDLKKVSQGSTLRFSRWDSESNPDQYVEIRWSSGTTEPGSSGGGFFTLAGSQYLLRGGLRGGTALCSNVQGTDFFSRFDQIYPAISQYLSQPGSVTPFANVTALWWVPSESGWGLNLIHRPLSNIVFGTWYTYGADGKRTWIVMPSGSWSSPNTYSGTLYTTSGPRFDVPYDVGRHTITPVGTGTLTFTDANNGTWTYSVNGLTGMKNIRRFEF
jgi:hypothetical protein